MRMPQSQMISDDLGAEPVPPIALSVPVIGACHTLSVAQNDQSVLQKHVNMLTAILFDLISSIEINL